MKSRAAVLFEVGQKFEVCEVDVQDPGPGEVRIQMVAGGVCHSDLHVVTGHLNAPLPAILGHEGAGIVADVGAGDGDFAVELARLVGEEGRVIATEVEEDKVRDLRQLAEDEELANLTAVLGSQDDTGLAVGCCDGVLLRMVYHHFQEPAPMRADYVWDLAGRTKHDLRARVARNRR